jgi:hypothetical protein
VRTLGAAFLLLVAAACGAVGGLWAYMKAAGAEVDICRGPECTSGWYFAGPLLVAALIFGVLGAALLHGARRDSGP